MCVLSQFYTDLKHWTHFSISFTLTKSNAHGLPMLTVLRTSLKCSSSSVCLHSVSLLHPGIRYKKYWLTIDLAISMQRRRLHTFYIIYEHFIWIKNDPYLTDLTRRTLLWELLEKIWWHQNSYGTLELFKGSPKL